METFRQQRAGPTRTSRFAEDYAFFHDIEGPCPGCGARRAYLVAFHHTDTDRFGTTIFARTLPHYRCDGERVIEQEDPERPALE
jgi:hypothetical protein